MVNKGIAPPDPSSNVGNLRIIIGDINYTPIDDIYGDYEGFSDDQLSAYLNLSVDNFANAAGYAYMALAAQFAADALKVTTDDESVDLTARAESMRKLAMEWFNRGDAILENESNNYFSLARSEYNYANINWPAELEAPDVDWWWR